LFDFALTEVLVGVLEGVVGKEIMEVMKDEVGDLDVGGGVGAS